MKIGILSKFYELLGFLAHLEVYGISFPWTYVEHDISPEDLSPELKDPYL